MTTHKAYSLAGASLLAVAATIAAPAMTDLALAQDTNPATETVESDTAAENFNDAGDALQEAGQETVQGVEAAGETAGEAINNAAQDAAQGAEAAAEQAELAVTNTADVIEQRSNWGWLGLLGLLGLFGLAGGKKSRRVEVEQEYRQPTTPSNYS